MCPIRETRAPLEGILVLDLADDKAAFTSKLLLDLGARVIKVEGPEGDRSRHVGPFLDDAPGPDNSLSFLYHNAGKLGVSLELTSDAGRRDLLQLASGSNVLIESFAPGYLEGLGLGYAALTEANPSLVMASITGYGQSGPHAMHRSCELTASASGGQMFVCGRADKQPLKPYGDQAGYLSSLFAAMGILLALREMETSGRGQHIDISMQEAAAAAIEHVLVQYFYEGRVAVRQGSLQWNGSADIFPCRDGHILLTFGREWDTLVELLEQRGMAADLKHSAWSDERFRLEHIDDIEDVFTIWTCLQDSIKLFKLGQAMRFPWAVVNDVSRVVESEQLNARGWFIGAHSRSGKDFAAPRPVINMGGHPFSWRQAPSIGEHNREVLETAQPAAVRRTAANGGGLPLQGIRVLDFTWMLAGPYATRLLGDFGAEVIKLQSARTATGAERNDSGYFATWNRNKLGITLDLSKPEARDLVCRLVTKCDVVMESFTPRVMDNWDLNYQSLRTVKPDLVMISLSGFGHSGPWREFAALGPTVQALSGLTQLTSYESGPPTGVGFAYADHVSGLYAALAVMAALRRRDTTGEGSYIDISEYEAACSMVGPALLDYTVNGRIAAPHPGHPEDGLAAPYGAYQCDGEDRWLAMAVFSDRDWEALCRLMGDPEWTVSEKFSTAGARRQNREELDNNINEWTAGREREELVRELREAGVAAAPVNDALDLARDPHLKERGFSIEIEHPVLGKARADGTPIRMSRTPAVFKKPAPLLGESNGYVFREILGMDEATFNKYVDEGVIA